MNNDPRSILILRFSSIGDIVQTTSVIGTLKSYFPNTTIDFMTLSKFAPLLDGHDKINKIHAIDINARYSSLRKIGLSMAKQSYDLIIDLHNTTRSRIIRKAMSNTKSLLLPKPRWKRFNLFMFHQNYFSPDFSVRSWLHEPLNDLLPRQYKMGETKLFVSDLEKEDGISILQNYGLKGDYFVLTPGAAWAQKRWPANYYSIIIDKIKEKYGLNAVLIGGVNDINCELITSNANKSAIDVHGKTNLRESLAIVSQAKFIIGNDTGFLHAGESLGISAITILGPTSRETGAGVFLDRSYVIENKDLWCRPCSQNGSLPCYRKEQYCMTQIPPELIMNQISKVVA